MAQGEHKREENYNHKLMWINSKLV